MGKISELSDELLIKILSYLPTQDAVSTSVLSKQWQFLWMWLPDLDFSSLYSDFESLRRFLLRNLPLHRAPVIESFRLRLYSEDIDPEEDVKLCVQFKLWVQFAVSRGVRELDLCTPCDPETRGHYPLPSSLYTSKFLVTLILEGVYMEVPHMVCLPSLKTLELNEVSYENTDSLHWLLSNCPVLEDLSGDEFSDVGKMIVRVPSLQHLSLDLRECDLDEIVIDTPSLTYLKLEFYPDHLFTSFKNMPKLEDAVFEGSLSLFDKLIRSIPSLKCLTLCLTFDNISEVVFDDGFVFNKLKHLKLCICTSHMSYVLVKLLKVSPNLRVLELFRIDYHGEAFWDYWNQPSSVPECMLWSLETLKWSGYEGGKDERDVVIYILQNAPRLKTATVLLNEYYVDKALAMKKELELSSRASTTCQLLFR